MSMFAANQEFLGKIISLTPNMDLTSDQEAIIFKLISQVDQFWRDFSRSTLPHVVMSRHPWRSLNRAPELFWSAINQSGNSERPEEPVAVPIQLTLELVKAYAEETGVGPHIQSSWPTLLELLQV